LEDGVKKGCCDDVGFMEHRKIVSELLSQIRGVISSLLSILDDSERLFGISSALGVPREDDSVKKLFLLPIYHLFIAMKKHEVELESVSEFVRRRARFLLPHMSGLMYLSFFLGS
jgi:hypothetical protein